MFAALRTWTAAAGLARRSLATAATAAAPSASAAAPAAAKAATEAAAEAAATASKRKYVVANLRLRAFDPLVLDNYARFMQAVAQKMNVGVSGTVPLPRRIRRFTVLRSPHIDKKSREQFEMRISSRLLQVYNTAPETALMYIKYVEEHLPSGVAMRVTEVQHLPVPFVYK